MAEPVNPFTPTDLAKYKEFFKQPARPNVFGTPAGQQALETERAGLASFLGATDYGQQLEQSQDMGKLQLALALAQRGFAAAGATPKRGESSISTLSRELFSPLAGDAGAVASRMMQQRQALKAAERQEERQLKLAALQNVQGRQEKAFADDASATQQARQFLMMAKKKGATVSTDYTVKQKDGSFLRQPITVKTDYLGNITYEDAEATPIPGNRIGVYTKPTAGIKDNITKATGIEVMVRGPDGPDGSPGKITYQPVNALLTTTFKTDGSVRSTRMTEPTTGQVLVTSGPKANARMTPKAGSKTSLYYAPGKGTSIYLTANFAEAFGLPSKLVGAKAELQRFTPKPDLGAGLPELQKIRVAGKTYSLQDHKNYNKDTGNIDLDTEKGTEVIDASSLWRLEDPKAYVDVGDPLTVPSGSRLAEIRKIKGLSRITANETLRFQKNAAGEERILYGNQTITLSPDESALFQVRGLSDVEKLDAGQTFRKFAKKGELTVTPGKANLIPGSAVGEKVTVEEDQEGNVQYTYKGEVLSKDIALQLQASPLSDVDKVAAGLVIEPRAPFVNTSGRTLNVGDQTIGPNQTGYFSKTDINSAAFGNVSGSFREVGPVSTDAVTYMFKEPKTIAVGDQIVEYTPGDEIRYTPQEFANLPKALQKSLTDDTALRATTLKKNYFTAVWKDVIKREGLTSREIKPEDLQTLLGIFPAGSRAGQKLLRKEINEMISLGATANPDTSVLPAAAAAYDSEETYAQSVKKQFSAAETRYNEYLEKGVIPNLPWGSLSYEKKRAFADMPRVMQITNSNLLWEKAQDRLAKDKASFKVADPQDVAAFSSAAELLILARHLRDGQELDDTGRFFAGRLGNLGANVFADTTVLTSGASQRLQQIINRMQASYATLSAVEGGGRDSVFRQQLQAALVPSFKNKTEAMNRNDLDSMINRLETNIRSVFNKEIQSTSTVPKIFELMAKEAGMTGVSVDQKRYRWLDPNEKESPPVTRQRVMAAINMVPFSIGDVRDLKAGRLLPPASDMPDKRFVKIKNLGDGEVLIQRARNDGKPDSEFRPIVMSLDPESKKIKTRYQNGR
jgi:hypothetical protein